MENARGAFGGGLRWRKGAGVVGSRARDMMQTAIEMLVLQTCWLKAGSWVILAYLVPSAACQGT